MDPNHFLDECGEEESRSLWEEADHWEQEVRFELEQSGRLSEAEERNVLDQWENISVF